MLSCKSVNKRKHENKLIVYFRTLCFATENEPRTLSEVAGVFQKTMKTLYDTYFPNVEAHRLCLNPDSEEKGFMRFYYKNFR